jgi:hypothetical protein
MAIKTKKQSKKPKSTSDGAFSGYVESIMAGSGFRFEVAGKKSGWRTFSIHAADPMHFSAMTALVTSSYLAGKKVNVMGAPNGGDAYVASEIRIGAKSRAIKSKPLKPKAAKAAETSHVPPALPTPAA